MPKYRKKPIVIEAFRWTGDNYKTIKKFAGASCGDITSDKSLVINTPEGRMTASQWDFIIKGIKGEFYPCKPDIFEATYEKVE